MEEFFRGKQVIFLVASGVGGGYDAYRARICAPCGKTYSRPSGHHAEEHARGMRTCRHQHALYARRKDGLTIAALTNDIAMDPLFGNPGARFDALKFNWIGSIGKLQNVCATWIKVRSRPSKRCGPAK